VHLDPLGGTGKDSRVTSYLQRYIGGDYESVWAELRSLGSVPDGLVEDCRAVAAVTMQRVHRHVVRLAEALTDLGLVPNGALLTPVTEADRTSLVALAGEIGPLPAALEACLLYVGGVGFTGDCAALDLCYSSGDQYSVTPVLPDPLVLPDVDYLRFCWEEYSENIQDDPSLVEEGFVFDFAPDELHKANFSGSTHDILLSVPVADPIVHGVGGRPEITLVEYLRASISWGGMPGWSFKPEHAPAALAGLRVQLDF
jgi:hypothetical protein